VLEREKIKEESEKKWLELEDQLEQSHKDLQVEIRGLRECGHWDKWAIFGLLTCMEQMETRMMLLQSQVMAIAPAPVVDLMGEEDEGGVGGPMELGSLFRMPIGC